MRESAANRRISAMRLMLSVPEVKSKLENGALNLTTLVKAQAIFRAEERAFERRLSPHVKREALKKIENKSALQAEQVLLSIFPAANKTMKRERFKRVRDLLSHKVPGATFVELADYLFKKLLKEESDRAGVAAKQSVKEGNKTITPKTRRVVVAREGGRCQFRDPVTGRMCGSTFQLQVDHRIPKALGGDNCGENLRCLCATHNRFMAERLLGPTAANRWRRNHSQGPWGNQLDHRES